MNANTPVNRVAAGLLASGVALAVLTCGGRAVASVAVPNAATFTLAVPAMSVSPTQTLPSGAGGPTLLTVVNKTGEDNSRGIAALAVSWINTAPGPQTMVSTGTSTESGVIKGQHFAPGAVLAVVGLNVRVVTENVGGNLRGFRIQNNSAIGVSCTVHEVW